MKIGQQTVFCISNASDVPLVINERFQNNVLVSGTKLVGGKTYGYFPSSVPMEGKTHLKGWQAPFGDIPETPFPVETLGANASPHSSRWEGRGQSSCAGRPRGNENRKRPARCVGSG